MNKKVLVLLIIININLVTAIQVNEIMYNPKGSDSGKEYIELYNPTNIWIEYDDHWFISDDKYKQKLRGYDNGTNATYILISPCNSILYDSITNKDLIFNPINLDDFGVPKFDKNGFLLCDKIGNNLKNSEDFIELWWCGESEEVEIECSEFENDIDCDDQENCIWDYDFDSCDDIATWCDLEDIFIYNSSMGGDGNGKSLQLINKTWKEAEPTPGEANQKKPKERHSLKTKINEFLFENTEYKNLFQIKIKEKDCRIKENVTVLFNVTEDNSTIINKNFTVEIGCSKTSNTGTLELTNGMYKLCGQIKSKPFTLDCQEFEVIETEKIEEDISLEIIPEYNEYEYPDSIKFQPFISDTSYPFKIDYWFENEFGTILRKKVTTLNINEKSYRPNTNSSETSIIIKANLSYIGINDTNKNNNFAEYEINYYCTEENANFSITLCLNNKCDQTKAIMQFPYKNIFKIENQNYKPCNKESNVTINYNITKNSSLIEKNTSELKIKKSKKSIDWLPLKEGIHFLCANIEEQNFCENITVIDTSSTPCNISLNIAKENKVETSSQSIKFYNELNNESFPYLIEYWIEDLFNNIIKNKVNTSNTNKKSFTKSIDEEDRIYVIHSRLSFLACNDSNINDNSDSQYILIKGEEFIPISSSVNSQINIHKIHLTNNESEWGNIFKIRLKIFKNNTNKKSISIEIKDEEGNKATQEDTSFNLETKNLDYDLTIPIQLKPNCNNALKDGIYKINIEGIGTNLTKNIIVQGDSNLCDVEYVEIEKELEKKDFEYYIENIPSEIELGTNFLIDVKLTNNGKEDKEIELYSYVYRGSKAYSPTREHNIQKISLDNKKSITIGLNTELISEMKPGEYNIKVKIYIDNQKTPKELTRKIKIIENKDKIIKFKTSEIDKDSIILLAEINAKENLDLEFKSFLQSKKIDIKKNIKINARLFSGENIFFLILKDKNRIIDIKELKINTNNQNTIESQFLQNQINKINTALEYKKESNFETIYESNSKKSIKYIPNIMFFTMLTLCVALIIGLPKK